MSNESGSVGPGWYHAEGDPAGTQRYWNGSEWEGEPQVVPSASTSAASAPPAPAPSAPAPPAPAFAGFGNPQVEEPRKSNALKWVLGILLFIVLGVGGCTFAFWRLAAGPIDAGNDYLNAIQAGDFDSAWSLSNASCFEGGSPQQLAEIFESNPVTAYDLRSTSVTNDSGEAAGRITLAGDDQRSISLSLTKVDDDWLVCGFDIGPPGS